MSTTREQIDLWRQSASEHQRLEFKEAKSQIDNRSLYEYCVALANEGGGHLILGVANNPPRQVVGTRAFADPVAMTQKLLQAVGFRVDIEAVAHPDGRVLVFHVPSRPSGTAYHLEGRYLMRSGSSLVAMSEDCLRRIFAEGRPDWLEGHSEIGLDAQQVIDSLDTQTFFELLKLPYPAERSGVIERLLDERLIDMAGGMYAIRRLGALMLARKLSDFHDLSRKAPRVIVYPGTSKLETRLDHIETKGYAVGFREFIRFIVSQIPQSEVFEGALRKEVKLAPEVAVRELVANSLIHQDFTIRGTSVMVEIFSSRIDISSPGEPIVPVERFIDGYESRNERLADLMRRMNICEEKSSGIDKVIVAIENCQLPPPNFRAGYQRTVVTLASYKPFEEMDRDDRSRACYQHCCLRYVAGEKMSNQSLRERFRLSEDRTDAVSRTIRDTIKRKLIKASSLGATSKRYSRYLPFWA